VHGEAANAADVVGSMERDVKALETCNSSVAAAAIDRLLAMLIIQLPLLICAN